MDSLAPLSSTSPAALSDLSTSPEDQYKQVLVDTLLSNGSGEDTVDVGVDTLTKGLTVSTQQIISKLNELLKDKVPDGVESLNPDDYTPEKTADRIVTGVTALFSNYLKQHEGEDPEKVLSSFLDAARSGVQSGYDDAFETLKGLGAFEVDGVQSGIEETKRLIEQKLSDFEVAKRKELGLSDTADLSDQGASLVQTNLLAGAGTAVKNTPSLNLAA